MCSLVQEHGSQFSGAVKAELSLATPERLQTTHIQMAVSESMASCLRTFIKVDRANIGDGGRIDSWTALHVCSKQMGRACQARQSTLGQSGSLPTTGSSGQLSKPAVLALQMLLSPCLKTAKPCAVSKQYLESNTNQGQYADCKQPKRHTVAVPARAFCSYPFSNAFNSGWPLRIWPCRLL